jgi:hypothetical protein
MRVFQANRTADLVHKLMNIYDEQTLKEEVMLRTLETLQYTFLVIRVLLTVGQ